ncbi:hypothetical protein [Sphingopyxis sp. JAI128]|uniref:hypothetical protein n=1 Tax=Sphingopyxis sp. JAI128 TaxID=2723066 RepID=UPI001620B76E|nr:hypothetical protein [Sphingopyxis sp. JAI128]MBB6424717.1 hypothetical protein [Sphingopyxis sp. JAI128]
MIESVSSPGIDPPSSTLSARLRELADYLAAPAAGRLTEEQRALSLGIARRLVADVAARLDPAIDANALWADWLRGGVPGAERLVDHCFARAEEHRWREQSAHRNVSPAPVHPDDATTDAPGVDTALSDVDRAYLALQIADRRRFDALGNPALAVGDLDAELFRALLIDIAAWRLAEISRDTGRAAQLGDAVRALVDRQAEEPGIADAANAYHAILGDRVPQVAADAIARHNWPVLIALAAAAHRRSYGDMALSLLTAQAAALPSLLAPLQLDPMALAPLEASLVMLPSRAVADGGDDDHDGPAPSGQDGR